jgi:hypothetical protein
MWETTCSHRSRFQARYAHRMLRERTTSALGAVGTSRWQIYYYRPFLATKSKKIYVGETAQNKRALLGKDVQTIDHLLFDCAILQEVRERLIGKVARQDNWPVNKSQLGNKYIRHFIQFTNTVDFTKLWTYNPGEKKCIHVNNLKTVNKPYELRLVK